MARYRIVLDFEGPATPSPAAARYLSGMNARYYAQLAHHLLELDPEALGHSLTRADVADAFPGSRLVDASLGEPAA